jgi:hypothetical protein
VSAVVQTAIAGWVVAAVAVGGIVSAAWRRRQVVTVWAEGWRTRLRSVLGAVWTSLSTSPAVSMEAGVAYARAAAQSGHPPFAVTQGQATADQPRDYLLAKTAETVWAAAGSPHSELEPHLVPVRNYLTALGEQAGWNAARDFALGVLTERVRQEEDGWPDQPGDPRGMRTAHGTGDDHLCLLERKHEVEDAIYAVGPLPRSSIQPT